MRGVTFPANPVKGCWWKPYLYLKEVALDIFQRSNQLSYLLSVVPIHNCQEIGIG